MKKIFLFPLIIFPVLFITVIYFLDKECFYCPIQYKRDFVVRNDSMGDGNFAAERSGNRLHNGIDLLANEGAYVFAARLGIVKEAKEIKGMGKYVTLSHFNNTATIYGHLSEISVGKGKIVRQGQVIGRVGKTGNANHKAILSHLHFEIRKNNIPQEPLEYLR